MFMCFLVMLLGNTVNARIHFKALILTRHCSVFHQHIFVILLVFIFHHTLSILPSLFYSISLRVMGERASSFKAPSYGTAFFYQISSEMLRLRFKKKAGFVFSWFLINYSTCFCSSGLRSLCFSPGSFVCYRLYMLFYPHAAGFHLFLR